MTWSFGGACLQHLLVHTSFHSHPTHGLGYSPVGAGLSWATSSVSCAWGWMGPWWQSRGEAAELMWMEAWPVPAPWVGRWAGRPLDPVWFGGHITAWALTGCSFTPAQGCGGSLSPTPYLAGTGLCSLGPWARCTGLPLASPGGSRKQRGVTALSCIIQAEATGSWAEWVWPGRGASSTHRPPPQC